MRSCVGSALMSRPPTFTLRSTNCAGVITPFRRAPSPYCTPALENGTPAKPKPAAFSGPPHALRTAAERVDRDVQDRAADPGGVDLGVEAGARVTGDGSFVPEQSFSGLIALLNSPSSAVTAFMCVACPSTSAIWVGDQTTPSQRSGSSKYLRSRW